MKCERKVCNNLGSHKHKDTDLLYCRSCAQRINDVHGQILVTILPRCGDSVKHTQTGETWEVAYVIGDTLSPAGWPETMADLSECEITRFATDEQHKAAVKRWLNSIKGNDLRRIRIKELYGHLFPEIMLIELEQELLGVMDVYTNNAKRITYLEDKILKMRALL